MHTTIFMFGEVSSTFLESVWWSEQKTLFFGSLRAKLLLASLCLSKGVWLSMLKNVLCSNLHTNSKHAPKKLIEHGNCCRQNNQLPIKSPVELKDNSITSTQHDQIELPFNSTGLLIGSWSPMISHFFYFIQNQSFLSTCGAC